MWRKRHSPIYSLKFFVAKKFVPNVDQLMLSALLAMDPVNVSLSSIIATLHNLVLAALVQRDY
jgi:hypothetical protein